MSGHIVFFYSVIYNSLSDFHKRIPASTVTYIGKYPLDPNKLLVARTTSISILTLDGLETILSGQSRQGYREGKGHNALYRFISEFLEFSPSSILISDKTNTVLRILNLTTNRTSRHSGSQSTAGHRDGTRLNALLSGPHGLVRSIIESFTYYVSDSVTHKIRRLNSTHLTTVFDGSPMNTPKGMIIHPQTPLQLYVLVDNGIVKLNLLTLHAIKLNTADNRGFRDGVLATAKFSIPQSIILMTPNSFLLSDYANDRLRIWDMENDTVSSICTGKYLLLNSL